MIAWLSGTIRSRDNRGVVLDVHGVGYLVYGTPSLVTGAEVGSTQAYHTYLHITDSAQDLYGFTTPQELALFKQLIGVSGVGPRSALSVLCAGTPAQVASAIVGGDVAFLTMAPGVGRKTAERIGVELRDKLTVPADDGTLPGNDATVMEALIGLGYRERDVREAVRGLTADAADTSARLKEALQKLSAPAWNL
jgi:holliday junction DNA helicase RuvA